MQHSKPCLVEVYKGMFNLYLRNVSNRRRGLASQQPYEQTGAKGEVMNAKDYLLEYKRIDARVRILQAEVEKLRTDAEGMSINLDGMPRSSGKSDKIARLAIQLASYETQLADELSHLWSKRMEIVGELSKLKNPKHFMILHARYIEGKTWEHIAVDMDITWRYCYMLHGRALAEFEKVFNG